MLATVVCPTRAQFNDYARRPAHAITAIEGHTLTLHPAQALLVAGTTIPGKLWRRPRDAVAPHEGQGTPVTEHPVPAIHRRWLPGLLGEDPGCDRRTPVEMRGSRHVPDLMAEWAKACPRAPGDEDPVALTARAPINRAGIHLVPDRNGRTCRLMVNAWRLENHYPRALDSRAAVEQALSTTIPCRSPPSPPLRRR